MSREKRKLYIDAVIVGYSLQEQINSANLLLLLGRGGGPTVSEKITAWISGGTRQEEISSNSSDSQRFLTIYSGWWLVSLAIEVQYNTCETLYCTDHPNVTTLKQERLAEKDGKFWQVSLFEFPLHSDMMWSWTNTILVAFVILALQMTCVILRNIKIHLC